MRLVVCALFLAVGLFQVESAAAQGNAEPGKKLWESIDARCRDCHGIKGEGAFGPDLAGRQLSVDQFRQAVRKPWGIMPAFTEQQISDSDIANFLAYFGTLPKVAAPGPWKAPLPAQTTKHGQELLIATVGCAQCHGVTVPGPRGNAGAVNADFEWFKGMVYNHTTNLPLHRTLLGQPAAQVRMGNYSRTRLPESLLQEIFTYIKDDLKFRPAIAARLTAAEPGTYNLEVLNNGVAGKGLSAEDLTVSLALAPGTKVTNHTGAGYKGVRNDGKTDVAVFQIPKLAAKDKQSYSITLSGGTIPSGTVTWAKPTPGSGGPDVVNVALPPPPPQTRQ